MLCLEWMKMLVIVQHTVGTSDININKRNGLLK